MHIEINFNKNKNLSLGKDSLTLSKQIFTRCSKEEYQNISQKFDSSVFDQFAITLGKKRTIHIFTSK